MSYLIFLHLDIARICAKLVEEGMPTCHELRGALAVLRKHLSKPFRNNNGQPFDTPKVLSVVMQRHAKFAQSFGAPVANLMMCLGWFHRESHQSLRVRQALLEEESKILERSVKRGGLRDLFTDGSYRHRSMRCRDCLLTNI